MKRQIYFSGRFNTSRDETQKKFDKYEANEFKDWIVFNPLKLNIGFGMVDDKYQKTDIYDRDTCYFFDIHAVMKADAIFVLNNWYNSMGALGELLIALNMNKEIYIETMNCKVQKISVEEMKKVILDATNKANKI